MNGGANVGRISSATSGYIEISRKLSLYYIKWPQLPAPSIPREVILLESST
jgi:hypothetical protein